MISRLGVRSHVECVRLPAAAAVAAAVAGGRRREAKASKWRKIHCPVDSRHSSRRSSSRWSSSWRTSWRSGWHQRWARRLSEQVKSQDYCCNSSEHLAVDIHCVQQTNLEEKWSSFNLKEVVKLGSDQVKKWFESFSSREDPLSLSCNIPHSQIGSLTETKIVQIWLWKGIVSCPLDHLCHWYPDTRETRCTSAMWETWYSNVLENENFRSGDYQVIRWSSGGDGVGASGEHIFPTGWSKREGRWDFRLL